MFRKLCSILFHFTVILNYVLFLLYQESIKDELYILFPKRRLFGGEWKYLTYWNIALQLGYFIIAFVNDIWGTESSAKEASSRLQKCRDFVFEYADADIYHLLFRSLATSSFPLKSTTPSLERAESWFNRSWTIVAEFISNFLKQIQVLIRSDDF